MEIQNLAKLTNLSSLQKSEAKSSPTEGFANMLENAIEQVEQKLDYADQKMVNLSLGTDKDIHGAMIAIEKADLSIKLLMAVRNKALSAYQEVSRMQI